MRRIILLITFMTSLALGAMETYYPQNMVNHWETGQLIDKELKDSLFEVTSMLHKPMAGEHDILVGGCDSSADCYKHEYISYTKARKLVMSDIYLRRDGGQFYIKDVYCNIRFTKGVGPNIMPNANVVNVEHTWPQSRFGGASQGWQKTDLHHLFPVDSRANSSRGNYEFGNVLGEKYPHSNCHASKVGYPQDANETKRYFQVAELHQGDTARAVLYFSIRYKRQIQSTEEFYLRLWHEIDPVSEEEIKNHERVFELQKNRNPFIDHPELVDMINDF